MLTPRSMQTELDFGTPEDRSRFGTDQSLVAMPASQEDANDWQGRTNFGEHKTTNAATPSAGTYLCATELADGRQALLIDPGSWGNLAGSQWTRRTAALAIRHDKKVSQVERERPLNVSGVGKGAEKCTHDVAVGIAVKTTDGRSVEGTFTTPTVNESSLPALLGLQTLIHLGAILDFRTKQLTFTGPGGTKISFSPGSDTFQLFQASSGHLMLPCCQYGVAKSNVETGLSLVAGASSSSLDT